MIIHIIRKIVDAWLNPSDQHLQGMQKIGNEAHYAFAQGQLFEQHAIKTYPMFKKHSTHSTLNKDQSVRDNRNAIWNFLSAALRGHSDAQYKLGLCYLHGQLGLDKNYTHAEKWLKKAANQGHHEAQMTLEKAYGQIAFS